MDFVKGIGAGRAIVANIYVNDEFELIRQQRQAFVVNEATTEKQAMDWLMV